MASRLSEVQIDAFRTLIAGEFGPELWETALALAAFDAVVGLLDDVEATAIALESITKSLKNLSEATDD